MTRTELQRHVDRLVVTSFVCRGELSDREVYEILRALGVSVGWVPWWQRAWWAVRRTMRKLFR